jgi:hypothetical protein
VESINCTCSDLVSRKAADIAPMQSYGEEEAG